DVAAVPHGETDWNGWLSGFTPRTEPSREAPMAIIYTSGTTGRPKGVRRPAFTQDQLAAFARMLSIDYGIDTVNDPSEIVTAVVGPTYHGAPNGHAMFSFRVGASVAILPRFD